jgi:hypothetical protein
MFRSEKYFLGFGCACALTMFYALGGVAAQEVKKEAKAPADTFGLGAGIGMFSFAHPDIRTTTIENGIVRVTESHRRESSIWLETHFTPWDVGAGGVVIKFGPFIGLQVGSAQGVFDSLSVGGMFSMPTQSDTIKAIGIGLGWGWTQIHSLGDGIVENGPLPAGVSNVRLKQSDIGGPVLMLSFQLLSGGV